MEFRLVSSLEKPGIGPDPEKMGPKPLYALGGETISFQLAFREKLSAEEIGGWGKDRADRKSVV